MAPPLNEAIRNARHRLASLMMCFEVVPKLPHNPDTRRMLVSALAETEALLKGLRERLQEEEP